MPAKRPIPRLRYWILALLFFSTLINYVDRQVLSNLKTTLKAELSWDDRDYAHVVLAFQVAYAFAMTGSGWLLDRIGVRLGFAITITLWSLAGMAHALARGVFSFGICRFFLGLGEAGNWPGSTKAVGEWFAPKDRAFATGVWNTGSATGALIAAWIVPLLAARFGWRSAFVLTGAVSFVWLAFWWAIYHSPRAHPRVTTEELEYLRAGEASTDAAGATATAAAPHEETSGAPSGVPAAPAPTRAQLLRRREVWGIVLARFLSDPVWWFYLFWLPGWLAEKRGFTLMELAAWSWIPWAAADVGSLVGGAASSLLVRRGVGVLRARKVVMVASALLMPCAILAARAESQAWMLALISVATFAHQCWASCMLTLPADLFAGSVVATCSGLSGTGATLGGMLATPLTGYVVMQLGYAPVFAWAGLMHPAAALLVLLLIRSPRRAPSGTGARPDL